MSIRSTGFRRPTGARYTKATRTGSIRAPQQSSSDPKPEEAATAAADSTPDLSGIISRSPDDIARVLGILAERGEPLRSNLAGGDLAFTSRLLHADPGRAFIVLEPSADAAANDSLLARPRASFRAMAGGLHIEFAAAGPEPAQHAGKPAIRMRFPDIMATKQRRAQERLDVQPHVPLHFVADAGGVISFDGYMVDISEGGIAFVQYSPNITLEPGTVLKGCRIEVPRRAPVAVDLKVQYSCPVTLPDGKQALRSGCLFLNTSDEVKALLGAFFKR